MELISVKNILENRKDFDIFYEDELVFAMICPVPVDSGHVVVFPKKDCISIEHLDAEIFLQMNYVATHCSTVIFESLGMHGTNLILYDGKNSNNIFDRVCIHVIGRLNKDGINFKWEPKKVMNLDDIAAKIKDQTFFIGKEKKDEKKVSTGAGDGAKTIFDGNPKENYLIKHLIRLP
jgi:diadenosine tetraphosphate (Ap4A) HIT family hydrolase